MASKTTIAWSDATWSPIRAKVKADAGEIAKKKGYTSLVQIATKMAGRVGPHCEHASPGCTNCYSETNNGRCLPFNGTGLPFDRRSRDLVDIHLDEKILMQPLHWKRPRNIFANSQTDTFGEFVPDEQIERMFAVAALCPHHTFQFLTKQAERMYRWFKKFYGTNHCLEVIGISTGNVRSASWIDPLPNVWLGVSTENQQYADERIPHLLRTPAAKRFASYEPALGAIDFTKFLEAEISYETTSRGNGLPSGGSRRVGDRAGRHDLAREEAGLGSLEGHGGSPRLQAGPSGERYRSIPSGRDNDRWKGLEHGSASSRLPSLQWSNTEWVDGEPRGWKQEAESPQQPYPGNLFRAADSRYTGAEGRARVQSERGAEFDGYTERFPGDGNQKAEGDRRETASDSTGLRDCIPDGIQDSQRGEPLSLIIIGGESGRGARPFHVKWAEDAIEQCAGTDTAAFLKQLGSKPIWAGAKSSPINPSRGKNADPAEWPEPLRVQEFPA